MWKERLDRAYEQDCRLLAWHAYLIQDAFSLSPPFIVFLIRNGELCGRTQAISYANILKTNGRKTRE